MITNNEAKRKARQKYIELWGDEQVHKWVQSHTLADTWSIGNNEIYEYTLDQDESLGSEVKPMFNEDGTMNQPLIMGGSSLPAHRSTFLVNRTTGDVQVYNHW